MKKIKITAIILLLTGITISCTGSYEELNENPNLITEISPGTLINPIIYAEISIGFNQPEEVEAALPEDFFCRDSLPYAAAFLAGQSFLEYRRRGGERRSPLPDFYIGAHAAVTAMPLLTRDVNRYRTYFPSVLLITP